MAEPSQMRQRSGEDLGVGGRVGQHATSAATRPQHHPGRSRLGGSIALVGVAMLLLPAVAHAGPGKLIAISSDSGDSFVSPSVFGDIERPKRITYRVTMDPPAPASGEADITCYRGKRDVGREFDWHSSVSFTTKVPLTLKRPESCLVSVDFGYDDFDQAGTAKIELFAKQRKRP